MTLTNNLIASNIGEGVIVWNTGSDIRIVNNTIVSNTAPGIEAADDGVQVLVRNTIIAGNNGGLHNFESSAKITSDHNALWNNGWNYGNVTPGTGDIEADPLFVDAANGDFHLQADSPCIDAGNPTGAPAGDIEGTPRDAAPDIGAYEKILYYIFLPATTRNFSTSPVTEWTERFTVTHEFTPPDPPEFSVHSFCIKDTDGIEHLVQLGSCDTTNATGSVQPLGGTIPLLIDDNCQQYVSGPAFDPVTYELGNDAEVTLSTESSSSEGDLIVAEFSGVPCD
jgi:hypothetical protein